MDLDKNNERLETALFFNVAGQEAIEVFNTLQFQNSAGKENAGLRMFEAHCAPRENGT